MLRDQVDWAELPEVMRMMLCDAQTSGGLLVAIPPEQAAMFKHQQIGVMREDGKLRVVS